MTNSNKTSSVILRLLAFLGVGILLGFANGSNLIPGMIWIVPGLLLALMRTSSTRSATLGLLIATATSGALQWTGVVPTSLALSALSACALGIILGLPYLADRLCVDRLPLWAGLFVFPTAQVSLELATASLLPYASFGAWAYTQTFAPSVLQIASLFGFWSISFVVATASPAIATALTVKGPQRWLGTAVAIPLGVATLAYGTWRLATAPEQIPSIALAGLASKPSNLDAIVATKDGCGPDACAKAYADARSQVERLFVRTEAAVASSKIDFVVWSEVSAPLFPNDVPAFLERSKNLARKYRIYFAPAVFIVEPGRPPFRNEVYLFDPDGNRVATHQKSKPVPGEISVDGADQITLTDTPIGKVGMAICYDMDFQALARQAVGALLMLVPGSDWKAIDPLHPNMVALRAVENGYAVVRPSRESVSVAFDGFGRGLARAEWQGVAEPIVRATLSVKAPPTLYSKTGDVFAYLSASLFLILSFTAALSKRRIRQNPF